jgi:hypothetical protein
MLMTLPDLKFGQPVYYYNLAFFPVVRQILIRTPDWLSGAVSPVALIILDGEAVRLTMLDDRISQPELICWLTESGILG